MSPSRPDSALASSAAGLTGTNPSEPALAERPDCPPEPLSLEAERAALCTERQAAEQALAARRQELEQQAQMLMTRLRDLLEREQQLDEEVERFAATRSAPSKGGSADATATLALEGARQQLREQQQALTQMQAEREAARMELAQLRQRCQTLEHITAEQEAALEQMRLLQQEDQEEWPLLRGGTAESPAATGAGEPARPEQNAGRQAAGRRQLQEHELEQKEKERRLTERETELHLEYAALEEMKVLAEQEISRERAHLIQERLRIARLREALRREQAALRAAAEQQAHGPQSSL